MAQIKYAVSGIIRAKRPDAFRDAASNAGWERVDANITEGQIYRVNGGANLVVVYDGDDFVTVAGDDLGAVKVVKSKLEEKTEFKLVEVD